MEGGGRRDDTFDDTGEMIHLMIQGALKAASHRIFMQTTDDETSGKSVEFWKSGGNLSSSPLEEEECNGYHDRSQTEAEFSLDHNSSKALTL